MNERLTNWPGHLPQYSDPMALLLMEQGREHTRQLDRIESKIDQIPKSAPKKNGNGTEIEVFGIRFKNRTTLILTVILVLMLTGHLTMEQIATRLLSRI